MATLFTKILTGEIKGDILYQDELAAAIRDINPQAPIHFLVVPKKELPNPAAAEGPEDQKLLGHLIMIAAQVADREGLGADGYRLVINVGEHAGQTVPHLHVHVLGGRELRWPPG